MNRKFLPAIFILLTVFLFGVERAEACSCVPSSSPCAVYQGADAVFIGTATAKEVIKSAKPNIRVQLNVDETFKGTSSQQETVANEGLCEFHFEVGKTYLVYAKRDKETNLLRVFYCSRTTQLENAAPDLEFIRLMAAGKPISTIYGTVEQLTDNEKLKFIPLKNIRLVMFRDFLKSGDKYIRPEKNNSELETFTDDKGNYRFDNLPEGIHRLKIFLPDGLMAYDDERKIIIKNPSCSENNFDIQIDGRISGKIVNSEGKPEALVGVSISGTEYNPYLYYSSYVQTDVNGNYEIKGLPPGKYKLIARRKGFGVTSDFPFTDYYFPGTFDESEAQIFNLKYAEKLQNVDLRLFPTPVMKKIQIELVLEDSISINSPDIYHQIYYQVYAGKAQKGSLDYVVYPDKDGKKTLTVYSGFEYKIYAVARLKDGRWYETEPMVIRAEKMPEFIKLVAKLRK